MKTVTLYEDNAGHLFLHRQGDDVYYADVEMLDDNDIDVFAALYAGDTEDWTLPRYSAGGIDCDSNMQPRANYDERGVTLVDGGEYAGTAARRFLGLDVRV